jgi:hypothetical protein
MGEADPRQGQEKEGRKANGNGRSIAEPELEATLQPRGLFAKLAAVLKEVSRVPKSGRNEHFKYDYVQESDLADHIRPLLAAQGIGLAFGMVDVIDLPTGQVQVKCEITLSDDHTEITKYVFGRAADKSDKGLYKATTGAVKYWLYKTFLVSTGDDPESDAESDKAAEHSGEKRTKEDLAKQKKDYGQFVADAQEMRRKGSAADLDSFMESSKEKIRVNMYYQNYLALYKELKASLSQQKAA